MPLLIALRTTTSRRGFAAAAPRPPVKPASSTILAICAVTSVCSSGGIIWIGSMPGALFHERCRCASISPGMSVAPMPSMTVRPPPPAPGESREAPLVTCRIRLPSTTTSPVYGLSPEPSMMRTLANTTPFDRPILSSAIFLPISSCTALDRSYVIRRQSPAFLRPFERRPVTAARQNLKLSASHPVRKPLRRARRRDRVILAGDKQDRTAQMAKIGALRRGQRLARAREAFRVLPQMALANISRDDGIFGLGRGGERRRRDRVGDRA